MRTILLWVILPISIYGCIPVAATFCMFCTPLCVHRSPKCALWTVCFSTGIVFLITDENVKAALFVLLLGLLWHLAKYWLLFQLSYDPVLKLVLQDREGLIEELKTHYHAVLWRPTGARS